MQGVSPDSIRRVLDSVFATPAYRWVEHPDPFAAIRRWRAAITRWFWTLSDRHPILFDLLTAVMVILLVAVLVHVVWTFTRTLRASAKKVSVPDGVAARRGEAWYRREAERLAAAGQYVEAMQAEFLALVLALDAARLLRFHPSKTPAEYLTEVQLSADGQHEFGALVASLYGFAFARWPCDASAWAAWRARARPERYATAG